MVKSHFTEQHALKNLTLRVKANEIFQFTASDFITGWMVVYGIWLVVLVVATVGPVVDVAEWQVLYIKNRL